MDIKSDFIYEAKIESWPTLIFSITVLLLSIYGIYWVIKKIRRRV